MSSFNGTKTTTGMLKKNITMFLHDLTYLVFVLRADKLMNKHEQTYRTSGVLLLPRFLTLNRFLESCKIVEIRDYEKKSILRKIVSARTRSQRKNFLLIHGNYLLVSFLSIFRIFFFFFLNESVVFTRRNQAETNRAPRLS